MKVISILMALVNTLTGGLLILSCVSASETPGWITLKIGAGILAIYFGIVTFKDSMQPIHHNRIMLGSLFLVIVGVSAIAWGIHWSIITGYLKNTVLLFGGSLFLQGLSSVLGIDKIQE